MDHPVFEFVQKEKFQDLLQKLVREHGCSLRLMDPQGKSLWENHPKGPKARTDLSVQVWPLAQGQQELGSLRIGLPVQEPTELMKAVLSQTYQHLQDLITAGFELEDLTRELVRSYEELAILYDLSSRLGTESRLEEICRVIEEEVQKVLPVTHLAILLVDEAQDRICSQYARDHEGKDYPPFYLKRGEGITGQVIASRAPRIVCDAASDPLFRKVSYPIRSLLCAPMLVEDKVIGTINASDKRSGEEFTSYDLKLISAIASQAGVAIGHARLLTEMKDLFLSTVKSLVSAIDAKDDYTHRHSQRVARYSVAIAAEMGLSPKDQEDMQLAALLHDVGKIGTPEDILLKPGTLTKEEWHEMKKHPLHSVQILEQIKPFKKIVQWVRHEHERFDGKGYPDGIKGEEIPMPSRIIAVADAYDAMTSDRHYRKRMSEGEALERIRQASGTQFDPQMVKAFLEAHQKGKLATETGPPA